MKVSPQKSIERLSMYRRLLRELLNDNIENVYSHHLAKTAGYTAAQVRRDLMLVGCSGNPKTGYQVEGLINCISRLLDTPDGDDVALVGFGNLGKALLPFFATHHKKLTITATFDNNPKKIGKTSNGCECFSMDSLKSVISENSIKLAILTVPSEVAQDVAEQLIEAGIQGILNFVPVPLQLKSDIVIENMHVEIALEKVAYLTRMTKSSE
ncbi:MAG: redox-sensing transcriptional repressor Rex [Kiritimatiellae bacterium]|nr:redox-sensing transcriptional repressor Rex [Kiritimatiellia bacterium]